MSVLRRRRLSVLRCAAGLGMLAAFPFVASGVAQAAMAGGNPLTTTNRPDLRSVHVNQGTNTAEFCFDKTISNSSPQGGSLAADAGRFSLGGYRFNVTAVAQTVGVEKTNTNCALATMRALPGNAAGPVRDLTSYSFGSVADNAVIAKNGGAGAPGNIGDSTANLDSNAHSGTLDHTTGPDLQAVVPDTINNRINYVFDQPVDTSTIGQPSFLFYDFKGNPHWGLPIGASGTIVSVQFNPAVDRVSTAQQAVVIRGLGGTEGQLVVGPSNDCTRGTPPLLGAVCDNGGDVETIAPTESVAVPGTSGLTLRPALLSAALVPGPSDQIDYTFSVPIAAGPSPASASNLVAVTSNGQEVQATSEKIIGANTVRATFPNSFFGLQAFQEEIVKASAYGCAPTSPLCGNATTGTGAVESVNIFLSAQTRFNATGGVSVGGNAGAFSTGFTDGPDARSVTFNNTYGTVTVQMDQRVGFIPEFGMIPSGCSNPADDIGGGCWTLLDKTGSVVDAHPTAAAIVNKSPFQSQVVLTYRPADLQRATALALSGPPVDGQHNGNESAACTAFSGAGYTGACTIRQVISPMASANAFLDPAKGKVSTRWHWLSKRQRAAGLLALRRKHHSKRHHQAAYHR